MTQIPETSKSDSQQALQPIIDRLDKLTIDVNAIRKDLNLNQKWQDRTWDAVKWAGGISAGLSISAAIALVGLLLRFAG